MASENLLNRSSIESYVFGGIGVGALAVNALEIHVNYWAGCFFLLAALYCASSLVWRSPWGHKLPKTCRCVIISLLIGLAAWTAFVGYGNTHVAVASQFQSTYGQFSHRLGKPEANPVKISGATSEQRLANATSIWAMNSIGYVLWDGTKRWEVSGQTTPPPRDRWLDDKWLREHFHPDGGGPPTGDLAYTWEQSPDYWKRMGMVQWRCGETPDVIYQDFEHGRIIGVLRGTLYNDAGIIFVLFDDYTWESVKVNSGMVPFASARACGCAYWEADKSAFVPVQ